MKEDFKHIAQQGLEHYYINKDGEIRNEYGRVLKSQKIRDKYGEYRTICLYPHTFDGKKGFKCYSVRKLVNLTFHPELVKEPKPKRERKTPKCYYIYRKERYETQTQIQRKFNKCQSTTYRWIKMGIIKKIENKL